MNKLQKLLSSKFSIVLMSDYTIGITTWDKENLLILTRTRTYLSSDFNEVGEGVNTYACIVAAFNCKIIPQGLVHTSDFIDLFERYSNERIWISPLFKEIYEEYINRQRFKRTNKSSNNRT